MAPLLLFQASGKDVGGCAATMASGLAEELLCPVCLAIFREPHMLSCGHNFCLPCLERCVLLREGACPECRRPFELREALPNRALARLAEKMLPTTTTATTTEESLVAAAAAAACAVGSCRFCDDHVQLFCVQDGALLCEACRDWPQHRGHDFLLVPDAVKVAQVRRPLGVRVVSLGSSGVAWRGVGMGCVCIRQGKCCDP